MKRLVVIAVALMIPTGVFAKSPCEADYQKFCKDLKSTAEVNACFDQHKSELSPACQANRDALSACGDDIAKFCKDVKRKQLVSCLGEHKSDLSSACQSSYESLGAKAN